MDGNKSFKEMMTYVGATVKSMFIQKQQESDFDSSINDSTHSELVATSLPSNATPTTLNISYPEAPQTQNFEGITLIWCDPRFGKTEDTQQTARELREINNYVMFYSDQQECINYIKSITNEKIFLIISGKSASTILPAINKLKQVDSIFVFCLKVEKYQNLLQEYKSIVGIYCERSDLKDSIRENAKLLQRQLDTFSFYDKHQEKSTRDLSKESAEFLWFQLFKDVILRMPRDDNAKQQLIQFCRHYYRGNEKEQGHINEFDHSYQSDKSIYWYTRETFLYKLVNKALRTEDIEQLHIFRFFIADLSLNLATRYNKENRNKKNIVMLYRGLKLELEELERLKQNQGNLISTNGFLSTSLSKNVAIKFAMQSTKRTNIISILYEIECNVHETKSVIFADITNDSQFAMEQEVLFDLGSTFKILLVNKDAELDLYVVKLQATDEGLKLAKEYIESNRKTNEETSEVIMFGKLLIEMGKYDESLKYFNNLLKNPNEEHDTARIYNEIGSAYLCKGELDEAQKNFERAYEMMIRAEPPRVKDSARPLISLANISLRKEEYPKALNFYFQALEIRKKFYASDHLEIATTLNNIGNVYYKMKEPYESLQYYTKSLRIRESQLSRVHLDIAASLNNMGLVHWQMHKLPEALYNHQSSLDMRRRLLPSEHNDIAQSLINIAQVFLQQERINEALEYFSQALIIRKIHFDPTNKHQLLKLLEQSFDPPWHWWPLYAEKFASVNKVPLRASLIDIPPNAKWNNNGQTVGGQNPTLSKPWGLYVDDEQTIYVADCGNHRIVAWKSGETNGQIVAGGHGQGNGAHQLNGPTDVIVDKERDSLIICDRDNRRVVRWPRQNGTSGEILVSNITCWGLAMDDNGFLYVTDQGKHEIRRYQMGESQGIVVAGGNGSGNRLDQIYYPTHIFVDREYSVFVSDYINNRVMKWMERSKEGIVVAGGQGEGNSLTQLYYPNGVVVDQLGTVYVADSNNHRIVRWPKGAQQGNVIVGENGAGAQVNQLNFPTGLSFDRQGNLYVVDMNNNRVQRFNIEIP